MNTRDPIALQRAAAQALLQIVDASRRSYVNPTQLHSYPVHTMLRVHDGTHHDEATRVEELLCLMHSWYDTVVAADKTSSTNFASAIMATRLWAAKVVASVEAPHPWGKSWAEQGFTDRAVSAAKAMSLYPEPAKKTLSRAEEDRLVLLRHDLRRASGDDAEELRERIRAITGEEE